MRSEDLVRFIRAREAHRLAKEAGRWVSRSKPDPIIEQFRFCNVRRNDDRVTKWIHTHFFKEWGYDFQLWFPLVVARLFNNEETLQALLDAKCILPFKPNKMKKVLHERAWAGSKNFNAAYIVSTNGRAMDKVDYVVDVVLQPAWDKRKEMHRLIWVGQLANAHIALSSLQGLGSFMAGQVLADLKYAPMPWTWEDFSTFACSGPGSRRGLNRIMAQNVNAPWKELVFRQTLSKLRDAVNLRLKWEEPLTAHDIQNCLCEFDKHERARLDQGRPKQMYKPQEKK